MVMYYYTIGRMLENSMRLTPEIDKWWIITLGFTIAVNLITPGLIIIRLWSLFLSGFLSLFCRLNVGISQQVDRPANRRHWFSIITTIQANCMCFDRKRFVVHCRYH